MTRLLMCKCLVAGGISCLIVIVLSGVFIIGSFIIGVGRSLEAERTMRAEVFAIELIGDYVSETRSWPLSWHELEAKTRKEPEKWQGLDFKDIRGRVQVDFSVGCSDVANMDVDNFSAVTPRGPHYPPDSAVKRLITTCHKVSQVSKHSQTQNDEPK
jgi:hypothetical protein